MNILFIIPHVHHYDSESVRQKPSGGTEKATIFLAEALRKRGHQVEVQTERTAAINTVWPDVVITQEAELLQYFSNSKRVWWCHHFSNQAIIQRNAAYARIYANHVVTLSDCQYQDFKHVLRIESTIIGHGVWYEEICKWQDPVNGTYFLDAQSTAAEVAAVAERPIKDPYRLIYASTPFRGLDRLPGIFKAIKAAEPRATIAIASSMATYGTPEADEPYSELFRVLRDIPGIDVLASLNQYELYREYAKASIVLYPCTWPETYCLAMDEAIAHGCAVCAPDIGALPERLGENLIFPLWKGSYIYNDIPTRKGVPPQDWSAVAEEWEALIRA